MKKALFTFVIFFSIFSQSYPSFSQPYIIDNEELKGLENSKIYVVMSTENSSDNDDYVDIFKEYWKYCPYEIIEPEDIMNYMQKGVYFMHMSLSFSVFQKYYRKTREYFDYELSIYTPKSSFLSKLEKKPSKISNLNFSEMADKVAYIKIKPFDMIEFMFWEPLEKDFMGNSYILTSGPGYLKNYLQYLQFLLEKKLFIEETKSVINMEEVKKLKYETLYIPEDYLKGFLKDNFEKTGKYVYDVNNLIKDYKYPGKFEIISLNKLNEKILTSDKPFYYMNFSFDCKNLFGVSLYITNSETGEIIYKETMTSFKYKSFYDKTFEKLSILLNSGS